MSAVCKTVFIDYILFCVGIDSQFDQRGERRGGGGDSIALARLNLFQLPFSMSLFLLGRGQFEGCTQAAKAANVQQAKQKMGLLFPLSLHSQEVV